ncbi:hypothetical protein [Streptomyces sp. SID5785]|uniref:hypothetical protein n=1 Tax=Streptomyces sp. SID5785 TaxID=2690309 RepID=UPI001929238A|nr:hypothetical protein [Streptomyces sp. SID5785]
MYDGNEGNGPAPLACLAERGLLVASHAVRAGWQHRALYRELARSGWVRVVAGVWAEPGRRVDLLMRLRAEQALCARLVVSHLAAAVLWRIEMPGAVAAVPEFIDPERRKRSKRRDGLRVHRAVLGPRDVSRRHGLLVTSPDRTLADLLLSGMPRDAWLVAVESALTCRTVGRDRPVRRGALTRLPAVEEAVRARPGARGEAVAWLGLVDPRSGSVAETLARLAMVDAGLRPESQAEVDTGDGRRVFLDFLFREEGLAVEVEGYAYHGSREQHRRDVERFNRIQGCPEVRALLRFTAVEVFRRPARMVARVRAELARLGGDTRLPPRAGVDRGAPPSALARGASVTVPGSTRSSSPSRGTCPSR